MWFDIFRWKCLPIERNTFHGTWTSAIFTLNAFPSHLRQSFFRHKIRSTHKTHTFYTQNYVHTFDTLPILCYILFNNVLALDHASRQDKLWWLLLLLVFLLCTQHSRPDATIELVPSIQTDYNLRRESPVRDVHNYYSNWLIFHLISVIRLY